MKDFCVTSLRLNIYLRFSLFVHSSEYLLAWASPKYSSTISNSVHWLVYGWSIRLAQLATIVASLCSSSRLRFILFYSDRSNRNHFNSNFLQPKWWSHFMQQHCFFSRHHLYFCTCKYNKNLFNFFLHGLKMK